MEVTEYSGDGVHSGVLKRLSVHEVQKGDAEGQEKGDGGSTCGVEQWPQTLPTFAYGSVPSVARLADAVVPTDGVKAQSVFITVVLICSTLIMF